MHRLPKTFENRVESFNRVRQRSFAVFYYSDMFCKTTFLRNQIVLQTDLPILYVFLFCTNSNCVEGSQIQHAARDLFRFRKRLHVKCLV